MNEMDSNSARTAITRKHMSKPLRMLIANRWITLSEVEVQSWLDYGCGRGFDADTMLLDKYDKYHYDLPPPPDTYDKVLCTYVLNVVSPETEIEVLKGIATCLKRVYGAAYISVRRDISREGTKSQRYVELPFLVIHEDRYFATYRVSSRELRDYLSVRGVSL